MSDNGPYFRSVEFKVVKHDGIKHTFVVPYHSQSNGLAEGGVQILKKEFKMQDFDGRKWSLEQRLAKYLLRYRVTPHSTASKPNLREYVEGKLQKMIEGKMKDRRNFKMKQFQKEDHVQVKKRLFKDKNGNGYLG